MRLPSSRPQLLVATALFGSACGFQLRGSKQPALKACSSRCRRIGDRRGLKRQIRAVAAARLADDGRRKAPSCRCDRENAALVHRGRVREVQLRFRYAYRVVDLKGCVLVPTTGIEADARRDLRRLGDSGWGSRKNNSGATWRTTSCSSCCRLATVKPAAPTAPQPD